MPVIDYVICASIAVLSLIGCIVCITIQDSFLSNISISFLHLPFGLMEAVCYLNLGPVFFLFFRLASSVVSRRKIESGRRAFRLTKTHLVCFCIMCFIWIALFAGFSLFHAKSAIVECFIPASGPMPVDGCHFSTETYRRRYQVLEVLSLFNGVFSCLIFVFGMGVRRSRSQSDSPKVPSFGMMP